MVFGSKSKTSSSIPDTLNPDDSDTEGFVEQPQSQHSQATKKKDPTKLLLEEVTIVGVANSKNAGGAKIWECNHCKGQYTSSYTRIHSHFFGTPFGKKAKIKRCPVLVDDRDKYRALLNKVKQPESDGVSKSLKNSVISKSKTSSSKKTDRGSFRTHGKKHG
ncbi:hypothetical protein L2E82_35698 [Cichorium intybus]|uniref:Uncharacterized protein n=1 Tax=Cichorium intybus TaxID=13427 RepID=A0ACB9BPH9_CICIN|nr:hypothetical protein L2E82_35698 [Cichorium intybus]